MGAPPGPRRGPGRAEQALNAELRADNNVPTGARAALRVAAHLLDLADQSGDLDGGAKILRAYLDIRQAHGLTGAVSGPLDPFAAFVAGLSGPTLGNAPDA